MKVMFTLIGLIAFAMSSTSMAQAIKSNSKWPLLAQNSNSAELNSLDEEIEDLEGLAQEQEVEDADFVTTSDSIDSFSSSGSNSQSRVRKTSKSKTTLSNKTRPRKRIVRRVIRRKRPAVRSDRRSETSTVVSKMAPLPAKASSGFLIKPFVGGSVSRIKGDLLKNSFSNNVEDYTGLAAGITGEYHPWGSWFGIEFGGHYVQTGANGDSSSALANTNRLNYICNEYLYFPVDLKLYPIRLANFEMFLKAGAQYGYLLRSTFAGTTAQNFQYELDGKTVFKDNDFQGNLGIGAKAKVSRSVSIGFDFVYNHGFVDISDSFSTNLVNINANGAANLGSDAQNTGFVGTLGVIIDI